MGYITYTDIYTVIPQDEVAQLTDDSTNTDLSVDTTNMDAAINKADAIINGYLRKQHTLPFSSTPQTVKDLSLSLTKYNLYRRRRATTNNGLDEGVRKEWEDSMAMLKAIAKGEMIIDDSTSFASTAGIVQTNKVSTDKVYSSTETAKF